MKNNWLYKLFLMLVSYVIGLGVIVGILLFYLEFYADLGDIALAFVAHIIIALGGAIIAFVVYLLLRLIKPSIIIKMFKILLIILASALGIGLGIKYLD